MNHHLAGHNIQLSIKGTITFYIFKSGQLHHVYSLMYVFINVKKWLLSE